MTKRSVAVCTLYKHIVKSRGCTREALIQKLEGITYILLATLTGVDYLNLCEVNKQILINNLPNHCTDLSPSTCMVAEP